MLRLVRRIGLTAAGLVAAFTVALSLATASRARPSLSHTCTVTDRQFIETARTNITAMGLWGQQYLSGEAGAGEVVGQAKQAAKIVAGTSPADPSLSRTRRLMVGMFTEYAKGVQLQAKHKDGGRHVYRSYGLANYAHDTLAQAEPALRKHGCDVAPLL
jgi:hypothetical protein